MTYIKLNKKVSLLLIITITFFTCIFLSGCIRGYIRSSVDFIEFSPDNSRIISLDHERVLQTWDISSGNEIGRFELWDSAGPVWFPNGERIIINSKIISINRWGLAIYNSTDFEEIHIIDGNFGNIYVSNYIGVVTTNFGESQKNNMPISIDIWNSSTYLKIKQINISILNHFLRVSPIDTRIVCMPSGSDSLQVIDAFNETYSLSLESMDYSTSKILNHCLLLKWSDDGERIGLLVNFVNDQNHSYFYVWDSSNGSLLVNKTLSNRIGVGDISPDCNKLAFQVGINEVNIIDINSENIIHSLTLSEKYVDSIVWSPDGGMVAAGSSDGIIKIWKANTGELIQTFKTARDRHTPGLI